MLIFFRDAFGEKLNFQKKKEALSYLHWKKSLGAVHKAIFIIQYCSRYTHYHTNYCLLYFYVCIILMYLYKYIPSCKYIYLILLYTRCIWGGISFSGSNRMKTKFNGIPRKYYIRASFSFTFICMNIFVKASNSSNNNNNKWTSTFVVFFCVGFKLNEHLTCYCAPSIFFLFLFKQFFFPYSSYSDDKKKII